MNNLKTSWNLDTIPEIIHALNDARLLLDGFSRSEDDDAVKFESMAVHYHKVRLAGLMKSQVGESVVVIEEVAL